MNVMELRYALEGLEVGMQPHIPDAWADREVDRDYIGQTTKMSSLAAEHDCSMKHSNETYIFEKVPPTGFGRSSNNMWPPKEGE
jgi:hypothetical protein